MDVFMMIDKMALPHFVEDALKNRTIPFAVIRDKKVIEQLVNKMKKMREPVYVPTQLVLTLSYHDNEYLS